MKWLVISLLFSLYTFSSVAQNTINWMTWDEMVVQREKDNVKKKIFIDLYTDWCGWCKKMDQTSFIDPSVVAYMNQHYYAVKLDAEMTDTINFNGHQFISTEPTYVRAPGSNRGKTHWFAYSLLDGAMSYPSYAILDEMFNRVVVYPGYKTQEELIGILVFFGSNQYQVYHNFLNNQWNTLLKQNQGK